jgi:long-chain acyl-CoA synthetase
MIQNFAQCVRDKAIQYKDKVFLCDFETGRTITYGRFDEITDRMADGFVKLGLEKGDRVALLHPNESDFILCYVAVLKAGGITVPINSLYAPREVQLILNDSRARYIVTTDNLSEKVKQIQALTPGLERILVKAEEETLEAMLEKAAGPLNKTAPGIGDPDDPAIVFYTSGTTGTPKGVILTHRNLTFGGANVAQNYGLNETDVTLAVLPLVHVFANASPVLGSFFSGGKVVVMKQFKTSRVFDAFARHEITWFPGVPTMFTYLLSDFASHARDVSALRMGLSGGASLPVESLRAFEEKFEAKILEVYGLTESTGLVTANPVFGVRKPGSIGITVSGVETKVVDPAGNECPRNDVGELIFRGANATIGYWNRPDETRKRIRNGWVYTGDHVLQDDDGYFFLKGRESELIISGGFNIYPKEIEAVLSAHPDVQEVAVIGIPDPHKGDIPKAFVVLAPGPKASTVSDSPDAQEKELLTFCSQNMAAYKIPRILFIQELPKNPVGKIAKDKLPKG